ncbi:MAG TPA: CbiX/SirB N-terminal domain-containing protein [Casimicrobiaceae bacterium]|nr:CbiX/SirB N-terminal domain-containing protein [Casimicrobiaceae bacterium]
MIAAGTKEGSKALILFAHGARDPGWAQPFERLAARVRVAAPGREVRLAFLELMSPDLAHAASDLVAGGAKSISVVPIFLGQGGHIRRDLPSLIEELRTRHPDVKIKCASPAGEEESVLEAMARYCVAQLDA